MNRISMIYWGARKKMREKVESTMARDGLSKLGMGSRFVLVLMALYLLCAAVLAQESTTEDWLTKARELQLIGTPEETLAAYDKAIEIDPQNV
ncbi:MAG: hypothetical protein METHAR1v1_760001, partial [Methanothrix sp.]